MRIIVCLLALAALSGCGVTTTTSSSSASAPPVKTAPTSAHFSLADANGTPVHGMLPPNFDITKIYQWVIFDHGYGQPGTAIFDDPQLSLVTNALSQAGYVVVSSDYSVEECWGNASCVDDAAALYTVFMKTLNLDAKPFVLGQSMGGLVMWNSILHKAFTAKAAAGIYPACNLLDMYENGQTVFHQNIEDDFFFTGDANFLAATKGYDPVGSESLTPMANVPAIIWSSYGDKVVRRLANEDEFAAGVSKVGGSVTMITTVGDHGDNSNFDPPTLVEFFNKNKEN